MRSVTLLLCVRAALSFGLPLVVSITEYGAVPDNHTVNTVAIQSTIDAVERSGGGYVLVPPGVFATGSVSLRSRVYLLLEGDLQGTANPHDYNG